MFRSCCTSCVSFLASLHVLSCVRRFHHTVRVNVGRRLPHMWGLMWGLGGRQADRCPGRPGMEYRGIEPSEADACSGTAVVRLDQTQLCCPLDGCSAALDVELAVDGLGMGADRAQG